MNIKAGLKELDKMIAEEGKDCVMSYGDARRMLLCLNLPDEQSQQSCGFADTPHPQNCDCVVCESHQTDEDDDWNPSFKEQESHLTVEQRMRSWLKRSKNAYASVEEWRTALCTKVKSLVEEARREEYERQVQKIDLIKSAYVAQGKRQAIEEMGKDSSYSFTSGFEEGRKYERGMAIAELKEKFDRTAKPGWPALNTVISHLRRELFGEDSHAK